MPYVCWGDHGYITFLIYNEQRQMAIKGDIYTHPTHTDRIRLQLNKPVLGSCQRSQLLATAHIHVSSYIAQCMQTIFSQQL